MLDQLMNLADQYEGGLREITSSSSISSWIVGAGIEVDPFWEAAELQTHLWPYERISYDYYKEFYNSEGYRNGKGPSYLQVLREFRGRFGRNANLAFRPADWDSHCKFMGYPQGASPVTFKVYIDEKISGESLPELPSVLGQQYPIRYEFRKTPKANARVSEALGSFISRLMSGRNSHHGITLVREASTITGTLGGFLRGANFGDIYMVTCAHVAGTVDSGVSARWRGSQRRIGRVSFSLMPPAMDENKQCSQTAMPGERSVDLSLVKLSAGAEYFREYGVIPHVQSMAAELDIRQEDPVYFVGKESGRVRAKIGSLDIWHQVEIDGRLHCYRRLVELKPIDSHLYVMPDLAKEGDSGSWVVDELTGSVRWLGMLVATEKPRAFMCLAESIITKCTVVEPLTGMPPDWFLK